jgi:MATE family, multidrug efflux pump
VLSPDRRKRVFALALPIIGGMVSQNLLNLVDTSMVGVLGNSALAAVGMANFAYFMANAFITGLAAGVQAMSARRKGEGRLSETAVPLNGGVLLAVGLGLPLSIGLGVLAPTLFPLLDHDPVVAHLGAPYLRARLVGLVPLGINFAFRGYWNAVDMSSKYLRTLVVMHVSNVILAWILIYGHLGVPALGVTGAGIATTSATFLGTGYYVALAWRHAREGGFLRALPDRESMRAMLKVSIPSGLQQFLFAAGMTTFFGIVGKIGTAALAAANVLTNLTLVAYLPGLGFGLAAATLVGQELGAKRPDDARRWGWEVARLASFLVALICVPAVLMPDLILRGFLHDPATRALAVWPLRIVAIGIAFDSFGTVLMNALLGAGDSRRVMAVAVGMQWVIFLPLAYLVGPHLGGGLSSIWALNLSYRFVQAILFTRMWSRGRWAAIRL